MINYSNEEGVIQPQGIRNLNGIHDRNLKLPHIALGIFSEHLLNDIVQKFKCEKVGEIGGETFIDQFFCLHIKV